MIDSFVVEPLVLRPNRDYAHAVISEAVKYHGGEITAYTHRPIGTGLRFD